MVHNQQPIFAELCTGVVLWSRVLGLNIVLIKSSKVSGTKFLFSWIVMVQMQKIISWVRFPFFPLPGGRIVPSRYLQYDKKPGGKVSLH